MEKIKQALKVLVGIWDLKCLKKLIRSITEKKRQSKHIQCYMLKIVQLVE